MNHLKLKSALEKFKAITIKEQIVGEYTPEEIEEIWKHLSYLATGTQGTQGAEGNSKQSEHVEMQNPDLAKENQENLTKLSQQEEEINRLRNELAQKQNTVAPNKPVSDKITDEDFKAYQKRVEGLDQRTSVDWEEYNAVGIWNTFEDQQTGDMKEGNILVGIELVKAAPLKTTRMEPRHIEFWMTGQRGKKVMGGLNAQIYDKSNNRANSRYYLLKDR